ncbi:M20/M25/M40 family metallo-hydrolase [Methyloglobulus sp.]|uniref:M20/M25/M40 family metallo-hydrolase n=1 Tax=Methyloglobulus sp. TaxID=2518622 RepID=UPI0032B85107
MLKEHQSLQNTSPKQAIILLIGVLILIGIGVYHTYPPNPSSLSAPSTVFSSIRAMSHVRIIGSKPHPTGSHENAEIRQYLVTQLKALGFKPEIQSTLMVSPQKKQAGRIHNVLVRIPGVHTGKSLLLSAHYDSVHTGPGAADDGASVAAILETLRAIKTQPTLQNDLICIFTDGEETGLLGAEAFIQQHPWAKDVGLVLNFEYRGNRGAFMMFETSQGNGKLIEGLAATVPFLSATSLFYEVYKHLPNDTDFTVFKRKGIPGMNFAAIEGLTSYHTQLDRPEFLDQGTLQHEGDIMLNLVKHFGNVSLTDLKTTDYVYFDFPGLGLVNYPVNWIMPLNGILLILCATVLTLALKTKTVRLSSMVAGAIVFPFILFGMAVASHLLWLAIRQLHPEYESFIQGDTYNSHWYLLAFVFLNIGSFSFLQAYLCKWLRPIEFAFGVMVYWLVLLMVSSVFLPGVSFLFYWPLATMLLLVSVVFLKKKNTQKPTNALLLFIGSIPSILIFAPFISNLFIGLTPQMIGVVIVFLLLLLGLLTPLMEEIGLRRLLVKSSLMLGLAALIAGSLTSGFDASRPHQNTLFYALNSTQQQAFWLSSDKQLDEWTSTYFPNIEAKRQLSELFGDNSPSLWAASAPLLTLPSPTIETLEDSAIADKNSDKRKIRVRIKSPRHAPKIKVTIEGIDVLYSKVAGQLFSQSPQSHWKLNSVDLIDEDLIIEFIVKTGAPFTVRVIDLSYSSPAAILMPRPSFMGISKNSKNSFSLREKVGMRGLKSSIYNPHPSPLPEGEGIFRDSLMISKPSEFSDTIAVVKDIRYK